MPNSAIELHDSKVTMIRREGPKVVLDVDAYVHVSEGAPGVDPGTVWKQPSVSSSMTGRFSESSSAIHS